MFRYGGTPEKNNGFDEEEDISRYCDYEPLTNSMKAMSRIVCN